METGRSGSSPMVSEDRIYEFLLENHKNDLLKILKQSDVCKHYPLEILFIELMDSLGEAILNFPMDTIPLADKAAKRALEQVFYSLTDDSGMTMKQHIHVRFMSLVEDPACYKKTFPGSNEKNRFMCLVGTIVRTSQQKLLEFRRLYKCTSCKNVQVVEAVPGRWHAFPTDVTCENRCTKGKVIPVDPVNGPKNNATSYSCMKDYQEVKLQEQISARTDHGAIPKTICVILEDDLLDSCKPGDDVVVNGTLILRWRSFKKGQPIVAELAFLANHVEVINDARATVELMPETRTFFQDFWKKYENNPFAGRNTIVQSVCPQVYGMFLVKLALAVVLAGGVPTEHAGSTVRGESHILLVGDPGTAKSQMLKYVTKIVPRSVFTTGAGTSSAGLTASAVRDGGEWHLEAGALVLADGGICCIDEFSLIKENDRTSIHEVMEQQTISVAKAGMVCKLNTKCSIVAATNPKLKKYDPRTTLELNVGLATPLLSRFDLIFAMKDAQNPEWDELLSDFILKDANLFQYHAEQARRSGVIWDTDTLKSYLVLVKEKNPGMSNDAVEVLNKYYQRQRGNPKRKVAQTTVRLLDSLYRLTQGHARITFKDIALVQDAIAAITLVEASMQLSAIGQSTNPLHVPVPDDPLKDYYVRAETVLKKLGLPEIWAREKTYLDKLNAEIQNPDMPPPPAPPPKRPSSLTRTVPRAKSIRTNTLTTDVSGNHTSTSTIQQEGPSTSTSCSSSSNQSPYLRSHYFMDIDDEDFDVELDAPIPAIADDEGLPHTEKRKRFGSSDNEAAKPASSTNTEQNRDTGKSFHSFIERFRRTPREDD